MTDKQKDQGSFDLKLDNFKHGEVVTRFPPEPSGYLHIGHAKAVLLNQYFAQKYGGKLIVRFDDTNPVKEDMEYENAIMEDLELLGVRGDIVSHTSDHFDALIQYAFRLLDQGDAYCDNTPQEQMRKNRFDGTASTCRDASPSENRRIFEAMISGSPDAQQYCLRARMSVDSLNKALRDPVIYRCQVDVPHHITGNRFKVYPTYDFACPIVDSVEGVTHALRTIEYHDRNDQYYWFLDRLNLRKPTIWDYSRLNFVYTLLSKRKLNWFVSQGQVSGWDDPRFPTVRGILRRGLTLSGLKQYILMQGASKNTLLLEWDKLWTLNKKEIDPVAPRYTALLKENIVPVSVDQDPDSPVPLPEEKEMPLHKKNPSVGTKIVNFSDALYLSQEDAQTLELNEEITLMNWGNVVVTKIDKPSGVVTAISVRLNLKGDFKLTKKKLTWLSQKAKGGLIPVQSKDFDFLITKKKLEDDDKFEDFINKNTEMTTHLLGEPAIANLHKGEVIQLERLGFYICDQPRSKDDPNSPLILNLIPDGSAKCNLPKGWK